MLHRLTSSVVIAASLGTLSLSNARASFSQETFDSYKPGNITSFSRDFAGWNEDRSLAAQVSSDVTFSGKFALKVASDGKTPSDTIWAPFTASKGNWSFNVMQYLPSTQQGSTYLIFMSNYIPGATTDSSQWGLQLNFDLSAGTVADDFRKGSTKLITDEWVSVRVDLDFDARQVRSYYNNVLFSAGEWDWTPGMKTQVNAVDLYTEAANTAYYDNLSLTQIPSPGSFTIAVAGIALIAARRRRS